MSLEQSLCEKRAKPGKNLARLAWLPQSYEAWRRLEDEVEQRRKQSRGDWVKSPRKTTGFES